MISICQICLSMHSTSFLVHNICTSLVLILSLFLKSRMWRKNRNPSKKVKKCIGVDINRNFDFEWKGMLLKKYIGYTKTPIFKKSSPGHYA